MERNGYLLAATTGILLLSIVIANASDCDFTPFKEDEPKCPNGTNFIYEMRVFSHRSASCCKPGSEEEKLAEFSATACRVSRCLPPSETDPCSVGLIYDTWYKGNKIFFEEVTQESCTIGAGSKGVEAYCCPKGSLDSALGTKMGAESHEFPHMALLFFANLQCGGSIYNNRWIMTAAHCIVDAETGEVRKPNKEWIAKVGRNVGGTELKENDYNIIEAISHPKYSKLKGDPNLQAEIPTYFNDIAFLKTDREIKFGMNVKALQVAPKGFDELKYADTAIIVGWGLTDTLQLSMNLLKANVIIRSDKTCFKNNEEIAPYFFQFNRTEQLLCVGGIIEGKWSSTAGQGDSGGPAICRGADGYAVICGVTSYGGSDQNCSQYNNEMHCPPSVYAEVDHFLDFINETAGEQDESTFYKVQLYGEVVSGPKYAHQVHITSTTGKSCGGTLISPDTVITAGQCVAIGDGSGKNHLGIQVWSGVQDISSGGGKSHAVKNIVIANGFYRYGDEVNIKSQGNRVLYTDKYYKQDLAVIKLNEPVNMSLSNFPRLPEEGEVVKNPALEYAFPRNTSRGGELRQREFNILDKDDCQRRMDRLVKVNLNVTVDDNFLCGVEKYSGGSKCDRELGGGLICKGKDGNDTLCGIQVFRLCEWSIPNGFLDIAQYSPWIKTHSGWL